MSLRSGQTRLLKTAAPMSYSDNRQNSHRLSLLLVYPSHHNNYHAHY
jgi:hypothetical protein